MGGIGEEAGQTCHAVKHDGRERGGTIPGHSCAFLARFIFAGSGKVVDGGGREGDGLVCQIYGSSTRFSSGKVCVSP